MQLRPYQEEAKQRILAEWDEKQISRTLINRIAAANWKIPHGVVPETYVPPASTLASPLGRGGTSAT